MCERGSTAYGTVLLFSAISYQWTIVPVQEYQFSDLLNKQLRRQEKVTKENKEQKYMNAKRQTDEMRIAVTISVTSMCYT